MADSKTTKLPDLTPDQAEYLKRVADTPGRFDPNVVIRGNNQNQTTRPAFIPPDAKDPRNHCYICGGRLGVFLWTDEHGTAHTSCVPSERKKWSYWSPDSDLV